MENYNLLYAPDTHPALWIGQPKPPKLSFTEWTNQALEKINSSEKPILIVSNSLNNLFPEIYDFEWLQKIHPDKKVCLLVDDSHGLGITGSRGEGVYTRIPKIQHLETIVIGSMAKAVDAGVILGTKNTIDKLRNSPVYAGASPPSPGVLYAYVNAYSIYQNELYKLRSNIKFFIACIDGIHGISYLNDFPVFLLDDAKAGSFLSSKGIIISSFAYPDPKGIALNRVVLNSAHTKDEMKGLAEALFEAKG
jgi:7-keto-8-aminopelargonate synthetase-like enzyme